MQTQREVLVAVQDSAAYVQSLKWGEGQKKTASISIDFFLKMPEQKNLGRRQVLDGARPLGKQQNSLNRTSHSLNSRIPAAVPNVGNHFVQSVIFNDLETRKFGVP